MEFDELHQFIEQESKRLKEHFPHLHDNEKQILARTVKLSEELGELCNEVLGTLGLQRKSKMENHDPQKLHDEFADVIIVALLLAKDMDVNIQLALETKIAKINKRYSSIQRG